MEYKRSLKIGVDDYTENEVVLDVYGSVNISKNVNVAGTITYDDVTNVDSIGLITARSGIDIGYPGTATTLSSNGDATFSGIVTAAQFFGDGSGLSGVQGLSVVVQQTTSDPVYPTFADNIGVSSIGIAQTGLVYIPSTGNLGIGSTQPNAILDVNPPSGYTGYLLYANSQGNSQFRVNYDGETFVQRLDVGFGRVEIDGLAGSGGVWISSNKLLAFSNSSSNVNTRDVHIERSAAGVLAIREGGSHNTGNHATLQLGDIEVYNTYTSATDFERANVGWTTDTFIVGTEKGSAGGTARQLELQTDGTTRVAITTDGNVGIGSTQPTATLDVVGDVNITGIVTATKFVGEVEIINPFLLMGA